ncbi:MAG: phage integrase SAM-like domain-containing protein [Rikenellaceae bacterium]|nr:phage integrase SAM-like domain-containing protein [Rikenellaceae bacterium]
MAGFRFCIRSTQKNKLVKVQILFTVARGNQFYADTQFLVLTDAWNNKTQGVKSRFAYADDFTEQQGRELMKNLAEMRSFILGEIAKDPKYPMSKPRLEKIIYSFHHPYKAASPKRPRESLTDYIARFAREMENGTRLNNHKLRYGYSTVKNYKGFIVQFDEFCKARRKRYDFNDIDIKFYDDFVAYFTGKDYSVNTIGRHVKELKIIMRAAREEGLHDNGTIESRKFRVLTAEVENIYLTESEIKTIADLDLSNDRHKDIARDIFLVGCYTAQRFSDYSAINEGNIRILENGQTVIDLKQQKTGNHVVIPARPELLAILAKYENRLPKSYEQKVNKYIKEIAREAGITEKIEISYVENGGKKTKIVEKCELVKTHTARRSGATNMYLAKIPTIAIMKITGHKTEKEFMKYIKITEEESAMELMNHPYFSSK